MVLWYRGIYNIVCVCVHVVCILSTCNIICVLAHHIPSFLLSSVFVQVFDKVDKCVFVPNLLNEHDVIRADHLQHYMEKVLYCASCIISIAKL